MQTRTQRAFMAAAALALFAGACTDAPTASRAAPEAGGRASLAASPSGPVLVSSAVKYRDRGGKPTRGRSGSAQVETQAMLASNGVTTLTFTARHATDEWRYGEFTKAQVRGFDRDGKQKFTRNFSRGDSVLYHPWQLTSVARLPGLAAGDRVQLQANVVGLDENRTDVVTVDETVKRLPDLRVRMSAPAEVESNTWVNVLAAVTEANGDVGAYAVCELFVAGQHVDIAEGVWVDAGDTVTCAMTWNFPVPGTYPLEVRVRRIGGWPEEEWDPADNVDAGSITVTGGPPRFHTSGYFSASTTADSIVGFERWRDARTGQGGESSSEVYNRWASLSASAYGSMPLHVTGPADLRVSMSTGGRVVHAAEWTNLGADTPWGWCTDIWNGKVMFWMCTGGGSVQGSTTFSYYYLAGSVTYHSRGYSKVWDDLAGTESVYHWNDGSSFDDTVPLGDDWTFDVRLRTAGAEYDGSRTLPLTRSVQEYLFPYECATQEYPEWGYTYTSCFGRTYRQESVTG